MRHQGCSVCGRGLDEGHPDTTTDEYELKFRDGVCRRCGMTLALALGGITEALRSSHGEKRERVIGRLIESLDKNGFDTAGFLPPPHRRHA